MSVQFDMVDIIEGDAADAAHIEGKTARLNDLNSDPHTSTKTQHGTHITGYIWLI